MPRIRLPDGQEIAYLDIGRGRPCVLLHGFGMRATQWRLVLAGMGSGYRFILPDLRGFGASHDAIWTDPDVVSQGADDLNCLLKHVGLDRPLLAGLSMGACVSMRYLGKYGDADISAYLNIDQAPCVKNGPDWRWGLFGPHQTRWFGRFEALAQRLAALGEPPPYRKLPRKMRWELEYLMARFFGYAFDSRAMAMGMAATLKAPGLGSYMLPRRNWSAQLACMNAYMGQAYDFRPGLEAVTVPVSVMVGMRSRMYPAAGQFRFRESVPHSQILRFERAGHAVPFEQPLLFRRRLRTLLDR